MGWEEQLQERLYNEAQTLHGIHTSLERLLQLKSDLGEDLVMEIENEGKRIRLRWENLGFVFGTSVGITGSFAYAYFSGPFDLDAFSISIYGLVTMFACSLGGLQGSINGIKKSKQLGSLYPEHRSKIDEYLKLQEETISLYNGHFTNSKNPLSL